MTAAAAFFDVDGTLIGKHIVHQYIYIRRRLMTPLLRPWWTFGFYLLKGPYYKLLDRRSRTRLNVVFYRSYAGMNATAVRGCVADCFEDLLRPNLFEEATRCIAEHRQAGRRIVLVTGSIDFIIQPLARHLQADAVLAPQLLESQGRFTGELDGPPVGEMEKARRVRAYAQARALDLQACFAYGDSIADLPMLQEVGHPHVVNPDHALADTAREFGWPTCRWTTNGGGRA